MPKKIKNCFYKNLTFQKLMEAHNRAKKHKSYKNEVIEFEMNLENNIINLLNNIKNNKYHLGKYYEFKIYEPKERLIKALPYIDRIVHQWYVEEFIKPYILPKFISTSFACIKNKGTHRAVEEVEKHIRYYKKKYNYFWILKCDVRKYFYSIDPQTLFNIMKRYITDKKLLEFTKLLIFEKKNDKNSVGIPIGNYTSQFFANIYLNELDYYVKRTLKIECYTRYMDDFIILAKTKQECKILKQKVQNFLVNNLHISLNDKSRYYPSKMGVDFCGYRIFETHRLLRLNSKKKIKGKVKKWNLLYKENKLDIEKVILNINSWVGHASHCNSYNLQNKILENCNFIVTDKTYIKLESELIELIENNKKDNIII